MIYLEFAAAIVGIFTMLIAIGSEWDKPRLSNSVEWAAWGWLIFWGLMLIGYVSTLTKLSGLLVRLWGLF